MRGTGDRVRVVVGVRVSQLGNELQDRATNNFTRFMETLVWYSHTRLAADLRITF